VQLNQQWNGVYPVKTWDERKDKSLQLAAINRGCTEKIVCDQGANILAISPPAIPGSGKQVGFTFELEQRESTDDIKQFEKVVNTFVGEVNKRPEIARAFSFFYCAYTGL